MAQITTGKPDVANPAAPAAALAAIDAEIRAGLTCHTARLNAARDNLEFYRGRNLAYLQRRESEEFIDFVRRPKRTSKITRKVVRTLTNDLYNPGPTRRLEGNPAADQWLQDVYRANRINAIFQTADRMATLNATTAVQAVATGRPEKPVCLYVWGAEEFVPFFPADDHTTPWAVCTIALVKGNGKQHRRMELWTAQEHRVYLTREVDVDCSLDGCRVDFRADLSGYPAGSGVNPYGVLPFEFVHDEMPVSDFWEGGVGTTLREANAEIDREMSDLAQHVSKYMNPEGFLINVAPEWRSAKRPGGWQHLRPGKDAVGGAAKEPKAFYVQAQLAVEQVWLNIMTYANNTLEELDVPLVAVRQDASTDLSGIAIVAKQLPLLGRTKARQVPFTVYEENVAKLVLTVAGNYYDNADLKAAAQNAKLSVVFPAPTIPLPSPERNQEDIEDVENNFKSEIIVLQERYGLTYDQAVERAKQIAKDKALFAEIMGQATEKPEPDESALDEGADQADAETEPDADEAVDDDYFTRMSENGNDG